MQQLVDGTVSKQLQPAFRVKPSDFAEDLDKSTFSSPVDYVKTNARIKAQTVCQTLSNTPNEKRLLVIGADSIVVMDGRIYEKPASKEEARQMMHAFSGKSHRVITALCISYQDADKTRWDVRESFEESWIEMGELTEEFIESYIDTKEPYDKAGGYGYQALGMLMVRNLKGCYYNVVGFPMYRLFNELQQIT